MNQETLEQKSEICVNHVRTLRSAYISDNEIKCRNCTGYKFECESYMSIKVSQVPFRKGRYFTQ